MMIECGYKREKMERYRQKANGLMTERVDDLRRRWADGGFSMVSEWPALATRRAYRCQASPLSSASRDFVLSCV